MIERFNTRLEAAFHFQRIHRFLDFVVGSLEGVMTKMSFEQSKAVAAAKDFVASISGTTTPTPSAAAGFPCTEKVPPAIGKIIELLNWIEAAGLAIGLAIAVIQVIRAGIYYQIGTKQAVDKAQDVLVNTGIGVIIIILASTLVGTIAQILCTGGGV